MKSATQPVLEVRRTIKAPREAVFKAWTEPEQIRDWWKCEKAGACNIAEIDLRVGGRYRLGMEVGPDATQYVVEGVYCEVVPPEKLVYTWSWREPDQHVTDSIVTVRFRDLGDGRTEVLLTHERLPSDAEREDHGKGWTAVLEAMAFKLEG